MKYCPHGYLIHPDMTSGRTMLQTETRVSPFCLTCWSDPKNAEGFKSRFYEKPATDDPCCFGFCDLITQVVNKRGFIRDSFSRESKELDLRARLIFKKSVIEQEIFGRDAAYVTNYIRRVLKNSLTNDQKSSEGHVIANSIKSLSSEGMIVERQTGKTLAGDLLTEVTGGESASQNDDYTLDEKEPQYESSPDKSNGKKPKSEARQLFDTLAAEASSQIATLTGGRKDGFETYLDLEKALVTLPADERRVFESRYLENGILLNRPRSVADVEYMTSLSTQNVRTLELKAIQKLRPVLAPSFFKRRSLN
ncbi:MAG TPA: hypothetical protein VFA74_09185 [Terriglobales bacterium]|nr:hypothetical protein [Terriglobales bacterium]